MLMGVQAQLRLKTVKTVRQGARNIIIEVAFQRSVPSFVARRTQDAICNVGRLDSAGLSSVCQAASDRVQASVTSTADAVCRLQTQTRSFHGNSQATVRGQVSVKNIERKSKP